MQREACAWSKAANTLLLPVQFSNVVHGIARFWYPHGSAQQTDKCVRRIVLCARPDSFGAGAIGAGSCGANPGSAANSNSSPIAGISLSGTD